MGATSPTAGAVYPSGGPSARFGGVMVGDDETPRMEQSLPVTPVTERLTSTPAGDDAAAVRASLEQMQRQLNALRDRIDRGEASPREHAAVRS